MPLYVRAVLNIRRVQIMSALSIKKLIVLFGAISVITVAAMALIGVGVSLKNAELSAEKKGLTDAQLVFKDIRFNIVQIQQFLTDVSATGDLGPLKDAEENLNEAKQRLNHLSNTFPDKREALAQISNAIVGLANTGKEMAMVYRNQGREAGNVIMQRPVTGFDAVSISLSDDVEKMSKSLDQDYNEIERQVQSHMGSSQLLMLVIGVAAVIGTVFLVIFLFFKIINPLETLLGSLKDLNKNEGDLSQRLIQKGQCEIGEIIGQFNQFIGKIEEVVIKLDGSVEPVISVATVVSEASQKSNDGAKAQAQQTDRIATAVTQMTAAVTEVAQNAAITMDSTREAESKAEDGQKVVSDTVTSINALAAEVESASAVIKQLEESTLDIGGVLDVIKGIAEQTNLLALNAAIEAARAGEQGRGFAVVADEVRTLAGRTQNSTAEIEKMTEQLQTAAKQAVQVMVRGHEKASVSVENASLAGEALDAIATSVKTIADMNAQIAASAEEQSQVSEEINKNIVSIAEVTDNSLMQAENTSEESLKLVTLARDLESLVGQFKS